MVALVAGAWAGPVGCTDTVAPSPCQGDVRVSATSEILPKFDWLPGRGSTELFVETVEPSGVVPTMMWSISASEQESLGPAVRYGFVARRAQASGSALFTAR